MPTVISSVSQRWPLNWRVFRPGGNVTGMSALASEMAAKRVELLKDALPRASRVAVLWNSDNKSKIVEWKDTQGRTTRQTSSANSRICMIGSIEEHIGRRRAGTCTYPSRMDDSVRSRSLPWKIAANELQPFPCINQTALQRRGGQHGKRTCLGPGTAPAQRITAMRSKPEGR
jgi:hypothetical protein